MFEKSVLSDDVASKLQMQWVYKNEFKVMIQAISELSAEVDRLSKELAAYRAFKEDTLKSW